MASESLDTTGYRFARPFAVGVGRRISKYLPDTAVADVDAVGLDCQLTNTSHPYVEDGGIDIP